MGGGHSIVYVGYVWGGEEECIKKCSLVKLVTYTCDGEFYKEL